MGMLMGVTVAMVIVAFGAGFDTLWSAVADGATDRAVAVVTARWWSLAGGVAVAVGIRYRNYMGELARNWNGC